MKRKMITIVICLSILLMALYYYREEIPFPQQLQQTETHTWTIPNPSECGSNGSQYRCTVCCAHWQPGETRYFQVWWRKVPNAPESGLQEKSGVSYVPFTHYPGTEGYLRYILSCPECEKNCVYLSHIPSLYSNAPYCTQITITVQYEDSVPETPAPENQPPIAPQGFTITQQRPTTLTVQWLQNSELDLDHYVLYLGLIQVATIYKTTAPQYTYQNLNPSTTYSLSISAVDDSGLESQWTTISGTTSAPAPTPTPIPEGKGILTGRCYDEYNVPLNNVKIATNTGSTYTSTDGTYSLTMNPGEYEVRASKTDYRTVSQLVTISEGHTTTQNFILSSSTETGSISGTVRNADPEVVQEYVTIEGATITLHGVTIEGATVSASEFTAQSDANGNFLISDIPPGTYDVTAQKSGYGSITLSNITVSAGHTTPVYFNLPPLPDKGEFSGYVYNVANDAKLPNVNVHISSTYGSASAITNAAGQFTIPELEPATYTVKMNKAGFQQMEFKITISAGKITHAKVGLAEETSDIPAVTPEPSIVDPESGGGEIDFDIYNIKEKIVSWYEENKDWFLPLLLILAIITGGIIVYYLYKKKYKKKQRPQRKQRKPKKGIRKITSKAKNNIKKVTKSTTKTAKNTVDDISVEIKRRW